MSARAICGDEVIRNGITFRWEKRFTDTNRTTLLYWVDGSRVTGDQYRINLSAACHHERKNARRGQS